MGQTAKKTAKTALWRRISLAQVSTEIAPVNPMPRSMTPTGAAGSVAANSGVTPGLLLDPNSRFRCVVVSVPVAAAAATLVLAANHTAAAAALATAIRAAAYQMTAFFPLPSGL
jgi:hypothetical protein